VADKTKCHKCGCPMEMVMGPKGKFIPVQKVTMAWQKVRVDGEERLVPLIVRDPHEADLMEFYVSHFQTCSDPARFSRKK